MLLRKAKNQVVTDKSSCDQQYTIYTYDRLHKQLKQHSANSNKYQGDWRKRQSGRDYGTIVGEAKRLYATGYYAKVEVKKRYFDFAAQCCRDCTFKIFEDSPLRKRTACLISGIAAICAVVAYFIAITG